MAVHEYRLRGASGSVANRVFPVAGPVTIGRAEECDLRLDDAVCAPRHAVVERGPFRLTHVEAGEIRAARGEKVVAPRVRGELKITHLYPEGERVDGGLITARFAPLSGRQSFIDVVEAVDLAAQPVDEALGELIATAARLFVAEGGKDIVLLHAITGGAALRLLLPALDRAEDQRLGLGAYFQSLAAAVAIKASSKSALHRNATTQTTREAVIARAATVGDEHSIKLLEAVAREHALDSRPELLAAAERWLA